MNYDCEIINIGYFSYNKSFINETRSKSKGKGTGMNLGLGVKGNGPLVAIDAGIATEFHDMDALQCGEQGQSSLQRELKKNTESGVVQPQMKRRRMLLLSRDTAFLWTDEVDAQIADSRDIVLVEGSRRLGLVRYP